MKARGATLRRGARAAISADWSELHEGDRVEIIKNARTISRGVVTEVSDSGMVLWISEEAEEPKVFLKSEGVLVRREKNSTSDPSRP